jgi:general secretion pathway protein J
MISSNRHSPFKTRRCPLGFTLLELLIAIVLVATMVVIVGGAMRLGYRAVGNGERKIETLERFRASLSIIRAQIQSAIPLLPGDDSQPPYFQGTADLLKLSTNYSIWGGQRGYVVVEYKVENGDNGTRNLDARETLIGTEKQRETRLLLGFDAISFEYLLEETLEGEGKWVAEWTDDTVMPKRIRLRLASGKRDISMIIPIRARGWEKQAGRPVVKP